MTEESSAKKTDKKRSFFLTKFVIILALAVFAYFGLKYWKILQVQRLAAQAQVEKFDNVESEIFDIIDGKNAENSDETTDALSDLTVNELKEKGAEFIYQMLLKNQVQINDLREQIRALKDEINKYKNHEKIGKMILTYVDLREKIFSAKPYSDSLKNFEVLTAFDGNLQKKIDNLKVLLPNFSNRENLVKSFDILIPDLIATKSNNPNGNVVEKIRHNISKLVVIRKIDEKNSDAVDAIIAKSEKLLLEENYQEAMNLLLSLNQNYHEILTGFLTKLNIAIEVQKIDEEILNYLKSLT